MTEKIGSWIEDGYYDRHSFVCSYCGEQIPFPMSGWKPKYCPSCGAKMVSVTELDDYEDLQIDLDDCVCDSCDKPGKRGCYNMDECKEDYPFGECCADNLEDNVGRICFENNLPSKLAKDLIGLIKKERERNESLYVHREYFQNK